MQGTESVVIPAIFQSVGTAIVSAILGFLGALAVFRAKFAVLDAEAKAFRDAVARDRSHDQELLDVELRQIREAIDKTCTDAKDFYKGVERRQIVQLEITASIARKAGVHHRALGIDALSSIVSGEEEENNNTRGR